MLQRIVIAGNILYILWILRNGIDEGFAGTWVQKFSILGMLLLLLLNTLLLHRKK